jgi:hypothetical protein
MAPKTAPMDDPTRDPPELELELLRRGVDQRVAGSVRCERCRRTPLIGERVYVYESEAILCELCRALEHNAPLGSRMIHGPAFGHTMRITDRRAA